jgi:hypothetical protein
MPNAFAKRNGEHDEPDTGSCHNLAVGGLHSDDSPKIRNTPPPLLKPRSGLGDQCLEWIASTLQLLQNRFVGVEVGECAQAGYPEF